MAKNSRSARYGKVQNDRLRFLAEQGKGHPNPWPKITATFNKQAKTLGWPKRSRTALQAQYMRLRRKDQKARSHSARHPFELNSLSSRLAQVTRENSELARIVAKLRKAIQHQRHLVTKASQLVGSR